MASSSEKNSKDKIMEHCPPSKFDFSFDKKMSAQDDPSTSSSKTKYTQNTKLSTTKNTTTFSKIGIMEFCPLSKQINELDFSFDKKMSARDDPSTSRRKTKYTIICTHLFHNSE